MNILFITQLFPFKKGTTHTTSALREFVETWAESGNKVTVIRTHFNFENEPFPLEQDFKIGENIDVHFVRPKRIPILKYTFFNSQRILKKLRYKPDVLVCHHYNAYFTFYDIAKKFNIPLVLGIHMSDIKLAKNKFHFLQLRSIYKKASAFACRSESYLKQFSKLYPAFSNKSFLALSGIPDQYIQEKEVKKKNSVTRILYAGMLIKRKQVDKIMLAVSKLEKNLDWQLEIIGEGPEEANLLQLGKELNIEEKIKFVGKISRNETFQSMKDADIFVTPSYDETFGLVYLEAMAAGCITIGSKNEGIDGTIINNKNGLLCDASNDNSIYDTIELAIKMCEDQRFEIIKRAQSTVNNFSIKTMSDKYLENLKKVIDDYNKA